MLNIVIINKFFCLETLPFAGTKITGALILLANTLPLNASGKFKAFATKILSAFLRNDLQFLRKYHIYHFRQILTMLLEIPLNAFSVLVVTTLFPPAI